MTKEFIDFAQKLATASGDIIRKYYRSEITVDEKSNRTPVTAADLESEQIMRDLIRVHYPHHSILGEEFETINPEAEFQWVLDPIDGTKNFVTGMPLFGTLIALLKNGQPLIGAINNPILNEFLVGDSNRTWLNGKPVQVRECESIEKSTLLVTSHWNVENHRDRHAFDVLSRRAKLYRSWGDCYGYYLVATGYADIMIDPAMYFWDVAALVPIIRGAGGTITDYFGNDPMTGEGAVATAGPLHAEVIEALKPK